MFGDKKCWELFLHVGAAKLPGKNILKTNGRPLIGWTIEMAKNQTTLIE